MAEIGTAIIVSLISTIIFIVVNGLVIWLSATKIFNFRDQSPRTAFVVAAIAGIISFILSLIPVFITSINAAVAINIILFIVNAIILIYLLKRYYDISWGSAVLAWVIVLVVDIVLGFLVGLLLGALAIASIGSALV